MGSSRRAHPESAGSTGISQRANCGQTRGMRCRPWQRASFPSTELSSTGVPPGDPNIVECLLLDIPETTPADPTNFELARFSRASADPNRRTAIVSSGEPCLVASPVVGLTAGCIVQTTRGVPHLSLSRHLAKTGRAVRERLTVAGRCPQATALRDTELPLRRALSELRDVADDQTSAALTFEAVAVLSRVELCLSRFVDQFQYLHGIHADAAPGPGSAAVLSARFGLTEGDAGLLTGPGPGIVSLKVTRLLLAASDMDSPMLKDLAAAAVQFAALVQTTDPSSAVTSTRESSDRPVRSAHGLSGGCQCPVRGTEAARWLERPAAAARDQATGGRDEDRLAEVEAEIAATPELPEDIVGDLEPVEMPEADIGNTVRLRNAWIAAKQLEAGWKKAREKADGEAEALKKAHGALEEERAALTERSDQLREREAEIARAERELEEQRSVAKAGFAPDLRVMTQRGSAAAGRNPRRGRTA